MEWTSFRLSEAQKEELLTAKFKFLPTHLPMTETEYTNRGIAPDQMQGAKTKTERKNV